MPLKELFKTRPKYITIKAPGQAGQGALETKDKKEIPDGLWRKCGECGQTIYHKELAKNLYLCPRCNHHFRVGAQERVSQLMDPGSFNELFMEIQTMDPLEFPDYPARVKRAQKDSALSEAVIVGTGTLDGFPVGLGVMESTFIMGSMGSVVGEKITLLIEHCQASRLPLIIVSVSGGARMQEGILSLMQMAKTSAALGRFAQAGLLYVSLMTDPTTAGVFASFGTLGDLNICEPGALLGFTGQRVIQQTIKQTLPPGFQSAEFQMEHGLVDMIVNRRDLRKILAQILRMHQPRGGEA